MTNYPLRFPTLSPLILHRSFEAVRIYANFSHFFRSLLEDIGYDVICFSPIIIGCVSLSQEEFEDEEEEEEEEKQEEMEPEVGPPMLNPLSEDV